MATAVVPDDGAALDASDLRSALRTRLSSYKVPVHVVVVAPDDIPWTASHKVRRPRRVDHRLR